VRVPERVAQSSPLRGATVTLTKVWPTEPPTSMS